MSIKKVILLIAGCLLIVILSACSSKLKTLDESELIVNLNNSDIVNVKIDNETRNLIVNNLVIEKRQINEKQDIIYCKIVQGDEFYRMTAQYKLLYNYYDQGGWILDEFQTISVETIPLTGVSEERAYEQIVYYDNAELVNRETDLDQHRDAFHFSSINKFPYMTEEKTIEVIFTFNSDQKKWIGSTTVLEEKENWDVLGKWHFDRKTKGMVGTTFFNFDLDIHSFDGKSIDATYSYQGYYHSYNKESIEVWEKSTTGYIVYLGKGKKFTGPFFIIDKNEGILLKDDYQNGHHKVERVD